MVIKGETFLILEIIPSENHSRRLLPRRYSIREQTLAEGMVSELSIERSMRHDTGIFICSATNAYGSAVMNIQLIVQEIPEPPKNVRVMDQLSRSIGVSWTQPYAGNSPITGYIVQYKPGAGTYM